MTTTAEKIELLGERMDNLRDWFAELGEQLNKLEAEQRKILYVGVEDKYEELIMAVGKKYPGESRHETALRYIRHMEAPSDACAKEDQK